MVMVVVDVESVHVPHMRGHFSLAMSRIMASPWVHCEASKQSSGSGSPLHANVVVVVVVPVVVVVVDEVQTPHNFGQRLLRFSDASKTLSHCSRVWSAHCGASSTPKQE